MSRPGDYGRHLREVVEQYRSLPPKERRSSLNGPPATPTPGNAQHPRPETNKPRS